MYEEQLSKLLKKSDERQDNIDSNILIDRFQKDLKELSREIPKLKSNVDAIQTRINYFQQRKDELMTMRDESRRLEKEMQSVLEDKILKENYFNRIQNCRNIIRHIYKCRTADDLPQKIFYDLPISAKHGVESEAGKFTFKET